MAVDYLQIRRNLHSFYEFTNKTVLFVGAGGRLLFDPDVRTKRLIAIDKDIESLARLRSDVAALGTDHTKEVVTSRFEDVALYGDTVYFEFCLHEMADPSRALAHAHSLAPDIVVLDHAPDSEWSYYAAEEKEVQRREQAMKDFGIRRREAFRIEQRFRDFDELRAKMSEQGAIARTHSAFCEGQELRHPHDLPVGTVIAMAFNERGRETQRDDSDAEPAGDNPSAP